LTKPSTKASVTKSPAALAPIEIWDGPVYRQEIASLERSHPAVRNDVEEALKEVGSAIEENEAKPGRGAGTALQRVNPRTYKKRALDSCHKSGRSGSFRFLHHWDRASRRIYLIMIWHKSVREDVPAKEVIAALKKAGLRT